MSETKGFSDIRCIPHDAYIMISDHVSVKLSVLIEAYKNHIPDAGKRVEPSGLEKLDECNIAKPFYGPDLLKRRLDWQCEHDRLLLEEVGTRIADRINARIGEWHVTERLVSSEINCMREENEQLEERIVARVASAARDFFGQSFADKLEGKE